MNTGQNNITSKRRDKLCILAEILEIAKEGTLKTQVMYKASLSFAQLNEYLELMLRINLLKKVSIGSKEIYIATDKGLDFLRRQYELTELLKSDLSTTSNPTDKLLVEVPPNKRTGK